MTTSLFARTLGAVDYEMLALFAVIAVAVGLLVLSAVALWPTCRRRHP